MKDRKKELNVQYNNTNNICGEVNLNNGVWYALFLVATKLQLTKLALQTTSDRNTQQTTITILCQHCGRNFKRQGFQNHQKKCATTTRKVHSLHLPDGVCV